MIMKFSEINESQKDFRLQDISGVKTFFLRSGVHKIAKMPMWNVFSIFDVRYFFNTRTVT